MNEKQRIQELGPAAWVHLLGEPVKRNGDTWMWRCWMHEDQEPSFHVNIKKGVGNCSPCGKGGTIFWVAHRLWNLDLRRDFRRIVVRLAEELRVDEEAEARKDPRLGKKFVPWDQREGLEAVYVYTDEAGTPLYEKAKFVVDGKKTFEQRCKTDSGYTYTTQGVRRVPYRLHEWCGTKDPVIIVEGEKDADRLASHGIPVTTTPDGSGVWKPEWNEYFKGRNVLLIPDNDEPGEKYCRLVSSNVAPVANEFRVWRVTSAKWSATKGADISDMLDALAGGDKALEVELLAGLWERADLVDPHEAVLAELSQVGIEVQNTDEILAHEDREVEHVWGQVLPVSGFSIVASGPGIGKSTFSRCLALAVARGEQFAGMPTRKGPVILFYLEEDKGQVRLHLKNLGLAKGDKVYLPSIENQEYAHLALEKLVRSIQPTLVVIDPMQEFLGLKDVNSYTECYDRLHPVREVARDTGAHIMMLHHTSKANAWILGSQALKGSIDSSFIMKREEESLRVIECDKIRLGTPFEPIVLEFDPARRKIVAGVPADEAIDRLLCQRAIAYITAENRKVSRGELMEALGVEFKIAARALAKNIGGRLIKKVTGNSCSYDVVPESDEPIQKNPDYDEVPF